MPKLLDWEQLQEDMKNVLNEVDYGAKVSRGSGAVKGNGDVQSCSYMAECKLRNTASFTINAKVFHKIRREAALVGKVPLLVTRNKAKETLVTLSLEDFAKIAGLPKESNGRVSSSTCDLLH